ncbi:MAG: hypothetical protein HY015_03555 [Bacteroidetes bacterium]|nr:hypothetical protein [Bacteroidota bacterium]
MPYKDRPFGSTEVALFVFMFRPKNSKDGLIEIKVPLNMSTSFSKLTNQDWKELQCDWYRQNGLKYDTAKLSSRFHNLKGLLPEIGNMSLGQAIAWLEAKKSQNEKSIEMFGVSVKREFVTVVGPIILCLLMLTYIGNILHMLAGIKKYQIKINHDILMNVISPSKFFNRLNISSLTILPCLVIIVVQVRLGFSIYSLLRQFV